jgi:hypothetical protein
MSAVARLLTFVDIDDADDPGPDARGMSVRARHEAVLVDGRRVVLLDDRGWGGHGGPPGPGGIWAFETVEGMKRTARTVVGPDEASGALSPADMEAGHWNTLERTLADDRVRTHIRPRRRPRPSA